MLRAEGSLLGEGLIGTNEAIAPYGRRRIGPQLLFSRCYTLYQLGPASLVGSLAVGYVIASFVPDDPEPTPRRMLVDVDSMERPRWTDGSGDRR